MPRIKKNVLPPELKEKLAKQYKGIVFEGSKHGFTIGDKVTTTVHPVLLNLIGVVIGFDGYQVLTYFKDSGFRGARGTDICTMHNYEYKISRELIMPRIKKPKWVQLTKENFEVGAIVRVRPDIETPEYQWGYITPLEEGVIRDTYQLSQNGCFKCDFPSQKRWSAQLEEMEIKI